MSKLNIILTHLTYWIIIRSCIFYAYTFPYYDPNGEDLGLFWITTFLAIGVEISEFYLYYKILIPRFILLKRNLPVFLSFYLLIMIIASNLRLLLWNQYHILHGNFEYLVVFKKHLPTNIEISSFYPILALVTLILENWISSELKKSKLILSNNETQINFLKTQINPHFIFNTLNNIYALSLRDKDKTSLALSKLQNTFSFLKKVESSNTVLVSESLEYLKSFIELSKLRLSRPNQVQLNIEDSRATNNSIYPMILVPFIENAFKHTNLQSDSDFIKIDIICGEKDIKLTVENTNKATPHSKDSQKGIGIKNVEERLNILYPEKSYLLESKVENEIFKINLKLPYVQL